MKPRLAEVAYLAFSCDERANIWGYWVEGDR